jgi:hypothetical protein
MFTLNAQLPDMAELECSTLSADLTVLHIMTFLYLNSPYTETLLSNDDFRAHSCDNLILLKNAVLWNVTPLALVRTDISEERVASTTLQGPHGIRSQKTAFFRVTTLKTSNLIPNATGLHMCTFYLPQVFTWIYCSTQTSKSAVVPRVCVSYQKLDVSPERSQRL